MLKCTLAILLMSFMLNGCFFATLKPTQTVPFDKNQRDVSFALSYENKDRRSMLPFVRTSLRHGIDYGMDWAVNTYFPYIGFGADVRYELLEEQKRKPGILVDFETGTGYLWQSAAGTCIINKEFDDKTLYAGCKYINLDFSRSQTYYYGPLLGIDLDIGKSQNLLLELSYFKGLYKSENSELISLGVGYSWATKSKKDKISFSEFLQRLCLSGVFNK